MRTLGGFCVALLFASALPAQTRGAYTNPRPLTSPFGSVVFPGGTSAQPGVQRTFGSVVFPGSGTPQFQNFNSVGPANPVLTGRPIVTPVTPSSINRGRPQQRRQMTSVYAYPVYIGGGGYGGSYEQPMQQEMAPPPPAQPNVVIVMPPQAPGVMVSRFSPDGGVITEPQHGPVSAYQPPLPEQPQEAAHYLIAFKDHTVYSAVAYWVDNDTLHYFTSGNTHNQVSLSLVDRDLTARLNKESGVELKLPAPRQ